MNSEDETFMKLRMGHLEQRKLLLDERKKTLQLEPNLKNFDEFHEINQALLDLHAEIISILQDEARKLDEEIERYR